MSSALLRRLRCEFRHVFAPLWRENTVDSRECHYQYVVDADLKSYFDTIPHDRLMQVIRRDIADSRLLQLIEQFLQANIMEEASSWKPMMGAPQGAVLSPLLSNIYLNDLDHLMARKGYEIVRYADDFARGLMGCGNRNSLIKDQ